MPFIALRFDRGTIELRGDLDDIPDVVWDPRSETYRVAASRFHGLVEIAEASGTRLEGDLRSRWDSRAKDLRSLALRDYQLHALASWAAFSRRGVVVLPTGAGKTRVALAAIFDTGLPTAILCPTKVLAHAWVESLRAHLTGEPIGLVGDGQRAVERVTVFTFESAFRHMDTFGDRFGLLVVDEVHHFGGGARREALEACAATARLGLTATAHERGSAAEAGLIEQIGPVVFEMGYGDLVGKHLADVRMVRIPVTLAPDERLEHELLTRAFGEMRRTYVRVNPASDVTTLLRALGRSAAGRKALRDRAKALALASFPRAKRSLVQELLTRHREDRAIVFTAFAENAYAAARDSLIPVIASETSARERKEILDAFRAGHIRAVASARVLNEGVDVPEASVGIIVAGTLGPREHVQRIGRVLRPVPGKHAVVYELITSNTSDAWRARQRGRVAPHATP